MPSSTSSTTKSNQPITPTAAFLYGVGYVAGKLYRLLFDILSDVTEETFKASTSASAHPQKSLFKSFPKPVSLEEMARVPSVIRRAGISLAQWQQQHLKPVCDLSETHSAPSADSSSKLDASPSSNDGSDSEVEVETTSVWKAFCSDDCPNELWHEEH